MLSQAAGILAGAAETASRRLHEIADKGADRHALVASRTILEAASRYRSDIALEARIRSLEISAGLRGAWNE